MNSTNIVQDMIDVGFEIQHFNLYTDQSASQDSETAGGICVSVYEDIDEGWQAFDKSHGELSCFAFLGRKFSLEVTSKLSPLSYGEDYRFLNKDERETLIKLIQVLGL